MPVYTYTCLSCKEEFDNLVLSIKKIHEESPCPKCGGVAKRKEIYQVGCNGQYLVFDRVGS